MTISSDKIFGTNKVGSEIKIKTDRKWLVGSCVTARFIRREFGPQAQLVCGGYLKKVGKQRFRVLRPLPTKDGYRDLLRSMRSKYSRLLPEILKPFFDGFSERLEEVSDWADWSTMPGCCICSVIDCNLEGVEGGLFGLSELHRPWPKFAAWLPVFVPPDVTEKSKVEGFVAAVANILAACAGDLRVLEREGLWRAHRPATDTTDDATMSADLLSLAEWLEKMVRMAQDLDTWKIR